MWMYFTGRDKKPRFGGRVDFSLNHIEKLIEKAIFFLIFSLLLSPFSTFQFHLYPTEFFLKNWKKIENRLQQELKNLVWGVDFLLHHTEKMI